mgnify:FL=1
MIIVTHEMAFARDVADHVIFMDDGRIVEQGDPRQVFENPSEERTKQFLSRFHEDNMHFYRTSFSLTFPLRTLYLKVMT